MEAGGSPLWGGARRYRCHIAGTVLLAGSDTGFRVFDVTNPRAPAFRATLPVEAVEIDGPGPLIYAVNSTGLHVIDVSNPSAPVLRTSLPVSGLGGIVVNGNRAYANGANVFYVFDVSNPVAPTIAGMGSSTNYGGIMAVSNGVAYLHLGNRIVLVDVSTGWPQLIGTYDIPNDDMLYGQSDVSAFGSPACYPILDGFQIIDASSPAAPFRRGAYSSGAHSPNKTEVSGNFAFVSDSYNTFQVFDVSDPRSPVRVGSYGTPYQNDICGNMCLHGNVAYVEAFQSDSRYLWALDISNPAAPVLLRSYSGLGDLLSINGNLGFFNLYEGGWDYSLGIYDVSDPLALRLLSSYPVGGNLPYGGVAVEGSTAYVACGSGGLFILDITNPSAPQLLATYDPRPGAGGVGSVAVRNKIAYMHTWLGDGALQVVDFSIPSSPRILSINEMPESPWILTLAGELLCSSDMDGLTVFDISNPSHPRGKGSYPIFGYPTVVGDTAYVTAEASGLWILRYVPELSARPGWQLYE